MIQTTTVGSYPVPDWLSALPSEAAVIDATRVVFDTQRQAGIDLPTDGELYRFDVNHPDTNGMIEYFVHKLGGIDSRVGREDTAAFRAKHEMAFRSKPAAVVRGPITEGMLNLAEDCARAGKVAGGPFKFTLTSPYMLARTLLDTHYNDFAALNMAIANDLAAENAQLDRTQIAFNQLMDCRFGNAQRIRADLRAGRLTQAQAEAMMGDVRSRTQRDIQLAQTINGEIGRRGAEFDTAFDQVAPGVKEQAQSGARIGRIVPVQTRAPVVLKLRPDSTAPDVVQVSAQEQVRLSPAQNGYALVETSSGVRGYAPVSAFPEARNLGARPAVASGAAGDVRSLAASNIARRDNFTETVSNAERLAQGQGFEIAS